MTGRLVSFVVPVYNEELNLRRFHATVSEVMARLGEYDCEFVFVDDGSRDASFSIIEQLREEDPRVRAVRFSRNFGSHVAIAAGLDRCAGDCAMIMAADLQDPPEMVPQFLAQWRDGHQVVWGARVARDDGFTRRALTSVFYGLVRRYAIRNYPKGGTGSFCLIDRKVVDTFRQCDERNRLTFGLIAWSGFKQTQVPYQRAKRAAGTSAWTAGRLVKSALDTFIGFSFLPIRAISYLGLVISLVSFVFAAFVLVNRLFLGSAVEGWTSVMVAVLFLSGVQLIMLGVLGEYLWRILDETRGRPLYVIERTLGFSSDPQPSTPSGALSDWRAARGSGAARRP